MKKRSLSRIAQISEFSNSSRTHDLPEIPVGAEYNDDCMFCTVEFSVLSKAFKVAIETCCLLLLVTALVKQ